VLTDPTGHAYPAMQTPPHEGVFMPTTDGENTVPAAQSVHATAPDTLYRPAGQMEEVVLTEPAGHA
jgi:hypothetical protein